MNINRYVIARTFRLVAAMATAAALVATPANAELVVQGADKAPDLAQGTTVPDDHTFDLQDGATLKLLQTPSGQNFEMRGPFKGTLQKFTADCNGWLAFTRAYCKSGDGDQLPVGGTRGVQK